MSPGDRYSLAWKYPHRIEAEVVVLEGGYVCAVAVHRCAPPCDLAAMKATLPLEGEMRFRREDFEAIYVPMTDAPALTGDKT